MRKLLAVTGASVVLMGISIDAAVAKAPVGGAAQSLSGNAVATVDGKPVTKAAYARWFRITARSTSASGKKAIPLDPPSYSRCIASLEELSRAPRSRAHLRAQCRKLHTQVHQQTMALLIQAIWFDKEAEALGIVVSKARVERVLRETKRESFPRKGDYERFLKASGMTNGDVLFRLRVNEIGTAISEHVTRGAGKKEAARRLTRFGREFQDRWQQQTDCRAGFVIRQFCSNG